MKLPLLLLLLTASPLFAVGEDDTWSKPDHGLRARLLVLPSEKPDSPFCRVFIELQNTEDVAGQRSIRFSPGQVKFVVVDRDGKALPTANEPYDGMSPIWKPTLLPYVGTIKFLISFPGLGYRPGADKVIVDLGGDAAWKIPQTGAYYLSGTFTVARESGDHPIMDWSGTLALPKVEIPKAK